MLGRVSDRSVREKRVIPDAYRLQSRPSLCTNFFGTKCSEGLPQTTMSVWLSRGLIKTRSSCTFVSSLLRTEGPLLLLPSARGKDAQSGDFGSVLLPPASAVCCPRVRVTCVGVFAFPQGFCAAAVLLWSTKGALSPLQSRGCD